MTDKAIILPKDLSCLVIGGSAGSFEPIYELIGMLPEGLAIPVIVVIHRGKGFKSNLRQLFQNKSLATIKEADEKEPLVAGTVYLAPVNFHLLVEPDKTLSIDASEPVLFCRPSIDVTFCSTADIFGKQLLAMLFSGANHDGAHGSGYIEKLGGKVLIEDPQEAEVDTMPLGAIKKLKNVVLFKRSELHGIVEQLPVKGSAK